MNSILPTLLLVSCVFSWGVVQNGGIYRIYVRQMIPGGKLCGWQNTRTGGGAPGVKAHERIAKVDCDPTREGFLYRVEKAGDGGWLITDTYDGCGVDWVKEHGLNTPVIKAYEHLTKMDCKYGSLPINIHDDGLDHIKISRRIHDEQCGLQMNSKTGGYPGVDARHERVLKFDCKAPLGDDVSFDLQLEENAVYHVYTYHDGKKCGLQMNHRPGQVTGVKAHERLAKFDCAKISQRFVANKAADGVHFTLTSQDHGGCGLQMAAHQEGESNAGIGKHETVAKFDCQPKNDKILIENGGIYVPIGGDTGSKEHYCALQANHPEGPETAPGVGRNEIVAKFDCNAKADRMVFVKVGMAKKKPVMNNVLARLIQAMLK